MDLNPCSSKKLAVEPVKCSIPEMDSFPYNLPDTCLNVLFDNLPLEDLIHCNLVCHKWNELYRAACSRRRKLTLIIGNVEKKTLCHSYPFANWDDKLSPIRHSWLMRKNGELDHRLVTGLMRNLVNITSLEIILIHTSDKELENIIQLLYFWAEKLVSLKLWPDLGCWLADFDKIDSMVLRLIDSINSLSRLTHLALNYRTKSFYTKDANNEPIMRIQLENLKEFNLTNTHTKNPEDGCKAILRYAQSHPNLRVGFDLGFHKNEHVDLLFAYDHQVASRVTQLCLPVTVTEPLLTRVCGHFTNLTTLQLLSSIFPAAEWTKALAQCSQLVHLKLDLRLKDDCPDLRNPPTKEQITQLKSIKMLKINYLSFYSHDDLQTLQFTWIFPCLEMIYITDTRLDCNICGLDGRFNYSEKVFSTKRFYKCAKLLLSPLKEFEHLKVVKYFSRSNGDVFYSKEDL